MPSSSRWDLIRRLKVNRYVWLMFCWFFEMLSVFYISIFLLMQHTNKTCATSDTRTACWKAMTQCVTASPTAAVLLTWNFAFLSLSLSLSLSPWQYLQIGSISSIQIPICATRVMFLSHSILYCPYSANTPALFFLFFFPPLYRPWPLAT